jgi:alkyl sulfatase BDS1-like metallo-beta-lactamase superfamily hydrolase
MRRTLLLVSLLLGAPALSAAEVIDPQLAAYLASHGEPRLEKVTERVYVARAYDGANFFFVVGDDGVVVVDASWHAETAQRALAELRGITDKPIAAVIYSHGHPDHTGGVRAFVPADREGDVPIYASSAWRRYREELVSARQPMITRRAVKQYGLERVFDGKDFVFTMGRFPANATTVTYLPPTNDVETETELELAGVRFVLLPLPSELDDELLVWLPDEKVAYAADAAGDVLVWLETPRMEVARRPEGFAESAERLAAWQPDHLIFGHGSTIIDDPARIQHVLGVQRDSVRTIIDQTTFYLNQGRTRDETAALVQLPPHLAAEPTLREHYHRLSWVVKGLYTRYSGWYGDDALEMIRHTPAAEAERMVRLAGGAERLLARGRAALAEGDAPWAAQLATYLLGAGVQQAAATALKAEAFRAAAAGTPSSNERDYLLTEAKMLDGSYRPGAERRLLSPDGARLASLASLVELLSVRFDMRRALDARVAVDLRFPDEDRTFGLEIDRGVLRRAPRPTPGAAATVQLTRAQLLALASGRQRYADAGLPVEGDAGAAARLFELLGI